MKETLYSRTALLLGDDNISRLKSAHVLVVGIGGVGGYAAEQLCRAGIGNLTLVDNDTVSESNLNRQIIAMHSTVGKKKTTCFQERLTDINPECNIITRDIYLKDEAIEEILTEKAYDYVIDAIDTLAPKVFLLYHAYKRGIPIVSSMGSAGKVDPTKIVVGDIAESHDCPLARMVRKRLHKLGVYKGIDVVFSDEALLGKIEESDSDNKRTVVGTISYVPAVFGCMCASVVIRSLINI